MRPHQPVIPVFALCLVCLISCTRAENDRLSNDQAINIAAHHLIGKSFDQAPPASVVLAGGKYTVTFTRPVPDGAPGTTYKSKVVFDARTREVLEIEVDADKGSGRSAISATVNAEPSGRPTPLNEEKDAVDAVRKQFGQ